MHKSILALLGLGLLACGEVKEETAVPCDDTDGICEETDGPTETGDTAPEVYETEIAEVTYGYDATEWSYLVDFVGWADTVTMTITQNTNPAWDEEHELAQIDFDPNGAWDQWGVDLGIVTTPQDQVAGSTTLFSGDAAMEATMAWRIDAYVGTDVVDCVVWGSDISLVDTGACREITF
jgi:hypothetical protein